jgi:hypothetical protein
MVGSQTPLHGTHVPVDEPSTASIGNIRQQCDQFASSRWRSLGSDKRLTSGINEIYSRAVIAISLSRSEALASNYPE